jgi:signal transduction histidine kinase
MTTSTPDDRMSATMDATLERTEISQTSAPSRTGFAPIPLLLATVAGALAVWAAYTASRGQVAPGGIVAAAVVLAWATSGGVVAVRRPGTTTGLVATIGAVTGALAALAAASIHASNAGLSPPLDKDIALIIRPIDLALTAAAGMHLLLVVPNGSLGSTPRRTIALIGYLAFGAVGATLATQRPDIPVAPLAAVAIVAAIVGGSGLAARYGKATATERKQMQWLGWGITFASGLAIATFALDALVDWPPRAGAVVLGLGAMIPLALVLATSPRMSAAIDKILSGTISLAGLASVVAVVYIAIVLGLGRVPNDREKTLLVLSMVAAAVAALLYIPTRKRLQAIATRLIYGERHAPDEVIRSFGSRLSRAIPLDELMLQMAESLRKTLGLDVAEVWTGTGGRLERTVSDPDRPHARLTLESSEQQVVARAGISGPAWVKVWLPGLLVDENEQLRVAPITHSGELLGLIVVRRHVDRGLFDQEEERIVVELARQVGLALHNVRLDSALQASLDELREQALALQASRSRIVAAADAERRRIERNLHDGAQQYLVALAVKVGLARSMVGTDQSMANELLVELGNDVQETLDELRRLAHGIYPPLLADRGLPEALKSAADRSPIITTVEATGLGRYPQEVEAAIYFCCLEALQNVGKYAGEGTKASIRVWEQEGGLLFEVSDDGAGFDVRSGKVGAGFTNMSDRVGAIGGTLRVESAPGQGTTVGGAIPLPK